MQQPIVTLMECSVVIAISGSHVGRHYCALTRKLDEEAHTRRRALIGSSHICRIAPPQRRAVLAAVRGGRRAMQAAGEARGAAAAVALIYFTFFLDNVLLTVLGECRAVPVHCTLYTVYCVTVYCTE